MTGSGPIPSVAEARAVARQLEAGGVRLLAMTMVDNAGIARVKVVPVERVEAVARGGVGMSSIWAVAAADDHFAATDAYGSPSGDMRLIPDLSAIRPLAAAPGYAWAPVWQFGQELDHLPACQRGALARVVDAGAALGLEFRLTFEVELTLLTAAGTPAHGGPGYSPRALLPLQAFALDLVRALGAQGIAVEQLHPEYSPGQFEVSVAPVPPLEAADQLVLLRLTARQVARAHGLDVSFAPVVLPDAVGNGCHLHVSAWRDGRNLMAGLADDGGDPEGRSLVAGVLRQLPALVGVLAPSVPSYGRLQPSRWAGAFTCWGVENREAALRVIPGTRGTRERSANLELKTVDGAANPYVAAAAVLGAGLDGVRSSLELGPAVQDDPATLPERERSALGIERLPESLAEAILRLQGSPVLRDALGRELFDAVVAVRRFEWERFREATPEELAAAHRFLYG